MPRLDATQVTPAGQEGCCHNLGRLFGACAGFLSISLWVPRGSTVHPGATRPLAWKTRLPGIHLERRGVLKWPNYPEIPDGWGALTALGLSFPPIRSPAHKKAKSPTRRELPNWACVILGIRYSRLWSWFCNNHLTTRPAQPKPGIFISCNGPARRSTRRDWRGILGSLVRLS